VENRRGGRVTRSAGEQTAMPPRNSMSISTSSIRRLRDSRALQPLCRAHLMASLDLQPPVPVSGLQLPDSAEMVRDIQALEPPMIGDLIEPSAQLATALAPEPVAAAAPAAYERVGSIEPVAAVTPVATVAPVMSVETSCRRAVRAARSAAACRRICGDPGRRARRSLGVFRVARGLRQQPPAPSSPTKSSIACPRRVIEHLTDRVVREAVAEPCRRSRSASSAMRLSGSRNRSSDSFRTFELLFVIVVSS